MKNKGYIDEEMLAIIAIIILIVIIIVSAYIGFKIKYSNNYEETCQLKEKWVKSTGDNGQKYLVSCGDNVYQITDLLFIGKFNSSDIYAKLEVGKTYKIKTTGYRIGLFNLYKNINEVEEQKIEYNVYTDNGVNFSDINAHGELNSK